MISAKSIIIHKINKLDLDNITIDVKTDNNFPKMIINSKDKQRLDKIKETVCSYKNWQVYRKLFTSLCFLNYFYKKENIGIFKKNVLSRSYFKLIEIQTDYNILQYCGNAIKVAFIAEAPGGFIEAFYKLRKCYPNDKYYGISLINNSNNIPNWYNIKKKSKNPNLEILEGYDKTGDIYKLINISNFINKIGEHTCEIVTADGGFDFTKDYINQEYNFIRLFLCEIVLGLKLQKKGGYFIIKCFDLTNTLNLKIFYLLSHLYEKIIITKLKTSRQTNSERYFVCKNYEHIIPDSLLKKLYNVILKWDTYIKDGKKIVDIFTFDLNKKFLKDIEMYNSWFYKKQLDIFIYIININNNLNNILIDNILRDIIKNNIENCLSFCKMNNIYINYTSYFLITDISQIIDTHFYININSNQIGRII